MVAFVPLMASLVLLALVVLFKLFLVALLASVACTALVAFVNVVALLSPVCVLTYGVLSRSSDPFVKDKVRGAGCRGYILPCEGAFVKMVKEMESVCG